jgi:hypothetical protein
VHAAAALEDAEDEVRRIDFDLAGEKGEARSHSAAMRRQILRKIALTLRRVRAFGSAVREAFRSRAKQRRSRRNLRPLILRRR